MKERGSARFRGQISFPNSSKKKKATCEVFDLFPTLFFSFFLYLRLFPSRICRMLLPDKIDSRASDSTSCEGNQASPCTTSPSVRFRDYRASAEIVGRSEDDVVFFSVKGRYRGATTVLVYSVAASLLYYTIVCLTCI